MESCNLNTDLLKDLSDMKLIMSCMTTMHNISNDLKDKLNIHKREIEDILAKSQELRTLTSSITTQPGSN